MKIEKAIFDFIKSKKQKIEIFGLRGLVKTGENEWSFRFTFRDGDFLGVSNLLRVKLDGMDKKPIFVIQKKNKKVNFKKIKQ